MAINKMTIDDQEIQVWTTDYADPPCMAVNMTQSRILLKGYDISVEESGSVTELLAVYGGFIEGRLNGYGETEFEAIAHLFSKAKKIDRKLD